MDLITLIINNRSKVLDKWQYLLLATYPEDTATHLSRGGDSFANPVGATINRDTESILEGLLAGHPIREMAGSLDGLIRIRAVQDFCPSEAVGYIFLLKRAVRESLLDVIKSQGMTIDLLEFESRIDQVALLAFDLYEGCRQKISEIRVGEARAETERTKRAMRMMNRTVTRDE